MKTPDIVVSLFSGTQGYLDKVDTARILEFEEKWLAYVNSSHSHLVKAIQDELSISDDTMKGLHDAMAGFLGETDFHAQAE